MLISGQTNYFLWVPSLLSIGVIIFFEYTFYPKLTHFLCALGVLLGQVVLALKIKASRKALFLSITICVGFAIAEIRTVISYAEIAGLL
ncbi:hypothetical protein [Neorickettsia helminthoeca]|uniref:hypothetical protein n=1 Tax=Neorickettsia helminthoeca TaxID=33994 RepID=UPI00068877A1|nr:hypothetical protein [Neorickettsia helminthoeca]